MKRIVLLSCSSLKLGYPAKARYLYTGTSFKFSLQYAQKLNPDSIYILSAKFGLLSLDDHIAPYDTHMGMLDRTQLTIWREKVILSLEKITSLSDDRFIFLTGSLYYTPLLPFIKNYRLPLKGMGLGKRLAWLKGHR